MLLPSLNYNLIELKIIINILCVSFYTVKKVRVLVSKSKFKCILNINFINR